MRTEQLRGNERAVYDITWGQSSPDLRSRSQSNEDFTLTEQSQNLSQLLKDIRNITYNLRPNKNSFLLAFESLHNMFRIRHKEVQTCVELRNNVTALRGLLKHIGIHLGNSEHLVNYVMTEANIDPTAATPTEKSKCEDLVIERFYAILVCRLSNNDRYGQLQRELDNLHSRGVDKYPKTMNESITTLTEYRPPKKGNTPSNSTVPPTNANVSFSTNHNILCISDSRHKRPSIPQHHMSHLPAARTLLQ